MRQRWILPGTLAILVLTGLVVAACNPQQRAALQALAGTPRTDNARGTAIAQVPSATAPKGSPTPKFSALATPTSPPTMAGPMGTLTAIAELVASPTQNAEPYVIENRGNPHFIEFHAWW